MWQMHKEMSARTPGADTSYLPPLSLRTPYKEIHSSYLFCLFGGNTSCAHGYSWHCFQGSLKAGLGDTIWGTRDHIWVIHVQSNVCYFAPVTVIIFNVMNLLSVSNLKNMIKRGQVTDIYSTKSAYLTNGQQGIDPRTPKSSNP